MPNINKYMLDVYSFCEPWNSKLYNYYTIINLVIYLITIVLF